MTVARTFEPPEGVATVLRAIGAMSERPEDVYVVGGTVRDVVLGRTARDLDLALTGDAGSFARALAEDLDGHFVAMDLERGIFRVVLKSPAPDGPSYVDVAALRGTIEQDLRRRDFTIDALGVPILGSAIVDPTGGFADIEVGLVRMTAPAVFVDDPLRLLRGARIAAELGFEVEATTASEVRARAATVTAAAGERQRDEMARILSLQDAHSGLRLLDELGLLDAVLPEIALGKGVTQPEQWHAFDVFEHGMQAVRVMDIMLAGGPPEGESGWLWGEVWEAFAWYEGELRAHLAEELSEGRPRLLCLRMAALLHDVGKPRTRTVEGDGRIRFFGHADEGAAIAGRIMRRLRFSGAEVRYVSLLVAEHLRPVQLAQVGEAPTNRALYRFNRALGEAMPDVLLLALADAAASRGPTLTRDDWRRHVAYMNGLLARSMDKATGILRATALLSGRDVMLEAGIPPGPLVGKLLEALREAEAVGDVGDIDEARRFVKRLAGGLRTTDTGEG